jgi:hypothetical protein
MQRPKPTDPTDGVTRTPATICEKCGHTLDAATPAEPGNTPKEGDFSVCVGCGEPYAFRADLTLRRLSPRELNTTYRGALPFVRRAREHIARRKAEN